MAPEHKPIVEYLLTICGVSFIAVGIIIYRANKLRSANRIFSLQMLIAGVWTINHEFSVRGGAHSIDHIRAGAAIAAILPWVLAYVSDVIASSQPHPKVSPSVHAVWGTISLALAGCPFFDAFIHEDHVTFEPRYGFLWIVYHAVLCVAMAAIALRGFQRIRTIQGRRRDEMVVAVIAAAGTIAVVSAFFILVSNAPKLPPAEYALVVIAYAFALAWIIVVRGIYDARALVNMVARSGMIVLATAAVFVAVDFCLAHFLHTTDLLSGLIAGLAGGLAAVVINRTSLRAENALLYHSISGFQRRVNDVTREAVSSDIAVAILEKIIAENANTSKALILSEIQPGHYQRGHLQLNRLHFKWQRTGRTEWISRESTNIDSSLGHDASRLAWLETEGVTLVLISPRSPQHLNIVVALGPRKQDLTYTLYELECLGLMVESAAIALSTIEASAQAQHAGKMMAIGLISASVIHEVKQPLAALRLFFKMLPSRFQDETFRSEYFEVIPRQLAHIEGTLSQLLRLGRSENYNISHFDPRTLIEETLTLLHPKASSNNVEIRCSLSKGAETIKADSVVLKQAILNLGLNALQAMAVGSQETSELIVSSTVSNELYEIQIRDTGPGLPPSILDRLFRPFVTTKEDGIGLGLYITRDQVVKTGGTLLANNHPEGGAVFRLRFPVAGREASVVPV